MTSTLGYYGDPMNEKLAERPRMSICFMCLRYKEHFGIFGLKPLCDECYLILNDVMLDKRNKEMIRLRMMKKVK